MRTALRETRTRLWHAAYCRWYDLREAGHPTRSRAWGRIADAICP